MNNETFDIESALKNLVEYVNQLASEITEIKKLVMDELINPVKEEYEKMQYDTALSDFRSKHAEKLEGFNDKLKKLEHDDAFDVVKKAFDDFSNRTDGMDEDTYVDKLAESIQGQLDEIASVFNVKPEEITEVTVETEDGEKTAEVEDGEVVATSEEADGENAVTEEAVSEESEPLITGKEDAEESAEESEEDTPEEAETKEAAKNLGLKRKDFLDSLKR